MTFELGRIITCRLPRFSALDMTLRQSASTEIFTTEMQQRERKREEVSCCSDDAKSSSASWRQRAAYTLRNPCIILTA